MRKATKYTLLMSMLIICALTLSGCGKKVADEEQIKQELESNTEIIFLSEGEQIEEIVIEKRQTDKEQKTDTVWCTIVTNDAEVSCQKNVILSYGLYDKTGWMLDGIEVESKDKWIMTPLKGVEESDLSTLLSGRVLVIGEEEWKITNEKLLSAKIEKQQTNLEQKTDQVTISLVIDEELERAEGKIEVEFAFNQKWECYSIISADDISVSMKEEYVLNLSNDDLMAKVIGIDIPVGETKQKITVGKDDISDFKVIEQKSESKGSRQTYLCSYTVNKSQAVLEMETEIIYTYQDGFGWNGLERMTTSKIISADIKGNWVGTYSYYKEKAELYISEVNENGTVTAVYTFAEGSYELSGTWNPNNLELWLEPGDWIVEPKEIRITNDRDKITGELKLEKNRFELMTEQGFIYFKVTED